MSARCQARSRFSCHGAGRRDPRRRGPRAGQACVPRPVQVADEELKKTKASRRSSRLGADRVGGQQGGGAEGLLAPPPVGDQVPADTPTPLSQRVSGVFAAVLRPRAASWPPRSRARPTRRRSRRASSRPPPAATSRSPSSSGYAHASVSESVWRVCCSSIMARRAVVVLPCRRGPLKVFTTEMPRPTLAADAAERRRRRCRLQRRRRRLAPSSPSPPPSPSLRLYDPPKPTPCPCPCPCPCCRCRRRRRCRRVQCRWNGRRRRRRRRRC